jgi:hypothetical protein
MSTKTVRIFVLTLFLVVSVPVWIYGQSQQPVLDNNLLVYTEDVDAVVGKQTVEILLQYYSEDQIGVGEEYYETEYPDGTKSAVRYVTYSFPHDPNLDTEIRRQLDAARGISPSTEEQHSQANEVGVLQSCSQNQVAYKDPVYLGAYLEYLATCAANLTVNVPSISNVNGVNFANSISSFALADVGNDSTRFYDSTNYVAFLTEENNWAALFGSSNDKTESLKVIWRP